MRVCLRMYVNVSVYGQVRVDCIYLPKQLHLMTVMCVSSLHHQQSKHTFYILVAAPLV